MIDFMYLILGILLVMAFPFRQFWCEYVDNDVIYVVASFIFGAVGGVLIQYSIFEIFSVGGWSVGEYVTMTTGSIFGLVNMIVALNDIDKEAR